MAPPASLCVVTPTLGRPEEVRGLLKHFATQTVTPAQVVLVDGAPPEDNRTREVVAQLAPSLSFPCLYLCHGGGTAVQRNAGIKASTSDLVALVDDDIRLEEDFFERMLEVFAEDPERKVGGVTGYITNQFLDPATSPRWRWYRRLRLFTTYEPGRYDFRSGYPINRYLQPPHQGLRAIDFMGAGCSVWRREVFDQGILFSEFFTGYGLLEDVHFALRAAQRWQLYENGRARCKHLKALQGRLDSWEVGRRSAVNYRYVFVDLVPRRTPGQEMRFWRVQLLDLLRFGLVLLRRRDRDSLNLVLGKLAGFMEASRLSRATLTSPESRR